MKRALAVSVIVVSSAAVLWAFALRPMPLLAAALLVVAPVAMAGAIGYLVQEATRDEPRDPRADP